MTIADDPTLALKNDPHNPIAHLSREDIEAIGAELDAIRADVMSSRGARDAAYIRRVIKTQRYLELGSRAVLLASVFPPAFIAGTLGLSVAKILENMEIGHNILHGQWDWMRDPKIHSTTWEWDSAATAEGWKKSHNEEHHTYTNIVGMDNDLGWGLVRVDEAQEWSPKCLYQPAYNFLNMLFFEYGIAAYDLKLGDFLRTPKEERDPAQLRDVKATLAKVKKQALKDYVIHPILSGPSAPFTLLANVLANMGRNVWSHAVIMCGHFPEGVETFELDEIPADETRGDWYLRQMLGSANISGSKAVHLMSGNLSHQIEHHIWPDLPSNRYAEVAPKVRDLFQRYGLSYNTRPLPLQVASAWHKTIRLSFPNGWWESTTPRNLPSQLRVLGRVVKAKGKDRLRMLKEIEARAATR
ncbi:fatty acid desaturase family protein [Nocardioides sp. Kera G14]|uniref:fatty acid desaturase family protein n=1 Tax=Nocardioides sp. Kera G14 TaxID=2884264 RepID=UPI001D12E47F|nr:acyl-CoA desaturase [Nocardioides sp. Kera G14]UDY23252.1 acyl-CoA desaturase [Nocardioides sp. Kera G14]